MDREDEKRYTLDEYNWHLLNNLQEFNDKPELIVNLHKKMVQYLPEHTVLAKFYDFYQTAEEYYDKHRTFPDIQWFEVNYSKTNRLKRTEQEFSIQVFEDCKKLIDAEIIKDKCKNIVNSITVDTTSLRTLTNLVSSYCDNADSIPMLSKNDIIGLYDDYSKTYSGISTGMRLLDEAIGVLGHKSLSVFGAPSGHGKSTFAISAAYNAVMAGHCVDYISYEVPKEHIWFNLVALHSSVLGAPLPSSDLKENKLEAEQKEVYRIVAKDLLQSIKDAGGYMNVVDQTSAAVDTFEGLCARIEGLATERIDGDNTFDRKADLIVVDNVDNFQVLRSSERDDMVKINNYIVKLDGFCKQYHHGDGCAILLLTQLNRGGLQKLQRVESSENQDEKATKVDVTAFQRFNALYEKATCCLIGYADAAMRASNKMSVYPVKLRNRPLPTNPILLYADYKYSMIGGRDSVPKTTTDAAYGLSNNQEPEVDEGLDMEEYNFDDMM